MIKGKYVAVVEIDFAIDENDPTIKPFDKIRDEVRCDFAPAIQGMLGEELEGVGKVTVNQMYADLYQVQAVEECNKKADCGCCADSALQGLRQFPAKRARRLLVRRVRLRNHAGRLLQLRRTEGVTNNDRRPDQEP